LSNPHDFHINPANAPGGAGDKLFLSHNAMYETGTKQIQTHIRRNQKMKFNKWTLGLAAVGAVSLTSVAQAEEKLVIGSQANMTATTISGYLDTSVHWNIGRDNINAPTSPTSSNPQQFGAVDDHRQDGINFNVFQLSLSKALDESEWSSGYRADLWFGPDANVLGTGSLLAGDVDNENADFAIRQAYVALRTPIGNGIDWKLGVFDTVVGYETVESGNNPNYTRSLGFGSEPTTHTGLLGTYRFCDSLSLSAGVVESFGPTINDRASNAAGGESYKTFLGSVALTAPSDWGWVAGSSLYVGAIRGYDVNSPGLGGHRDHYYTGITLATPVAGLKFGAAFDYSHARHISNGSTDNTYTYGLYASFQATEKLSLHGRVEYQRAQSGTGGNAPDRNEATLTAQYDLWKNVISRLELRWDHSEARAFDVNGGLAKNTYLAAANIIYKF
jgi:hypothetical protein